MDCRPQLQKQIVDEVYGFIKVYSDGSIERPLLTGGIIPPCPNFVNGVASQDVTIDMQSGLWARVFLPRSVASSASKAPVVLHFHAGGLCIGSPSTAIFHAFCGRMALQSNSIWISVDYRLAPEHRLPAAYDDGHASFKWLHAQAMMADGPGHVDHHSQHDISQKDGSTGEDLYGHSPHTSWKAAPNSWLHAHADYSRCFFAGESSGGAIVHYLMMQIANSDWSPIKVQGLLMIHPAFLIEGVFDTSFDPSKELRQGTLRRLCLPLDGEWDHPLVNPLHARAQSIKDVILPSCIIAVADHDKLCAPARHYFTVMKQHGHPVELHVTEAKGHCFYLQEPYCKESELLVEQLVAFICR